MSHKVCAFLWPTGSHDEVEWVFQYLLEGLQEPCAGRAVDYAMVARHGDAHYLPDDDIVLTNNRLGRHRADGENCAFGRIDDCRKLVDSKHSQIADREGGAGVFLGLESS